jgi:hypothetical protein
MFASLDRHFRDSGLPFSILRDEAFKNSRIILNGKAIELREADPLTKEDEGALWESGALGAYRNHDGRFEVGASATD